MSDAFREQVHRLTLFIERTLAGEPFSEPCRAFALSGKRLRARLLFAAGASNPLLATDGDLLRAAAAIELVHTASLLHDDVVDRCEIRRGLPALHRVVGVREATRSGLHLVELALAVVADIPVAARERLAAAARRLSRGQFLELLRLGDQAVGFHERTRIMELKTASVFGLSCELGALLVGGPPDIVKRWRTIGEAFGLLFQVADDLDDIYAQAGELGRPAGVDIRDGVMSLPIICGLESQERESIAMLLSAVRNGRGDDGALPACAALLQQSGAIERTVIVAATHAASVHENLAELPCSAGTAWIAVLVEQTLARCRRWLPHTIAPHGQSIDAFSQ